MFAEHPRSSKFLEVPARKAAHGEQAAISRLFEAEHLTRLLLQEKVNQILSEARSATNMDDLEKQKVRTLPSVSQTDACILIAWNFTKRIRYVRIPGESNSVPMWNWRVEKELSKKHVVELSNKMQELRKDFLYWSCENSTAENGWVFPIRTTRKSIYREAAYGLNFKNYKTRWTNSLSDSGDGSVHFPGLSVIVLIPGGMLSRDSCLQADARNLYGT